LGLFGEKPMMPPPKVWPVRPVAEFVPVPDPFAVGVLLPPVPLPIPGPVLPLAPLWSVPPLVAL
jgi:hypothetical protein